MPRAPQPRPSRLVAQLEAPQFQQLGPALRTLAAVEQIAQQRAMTEGEIAGRIAAHPATVKRHLERLKLGGFVRTRRLAHGLMIDIAPSPGRLFGVGNAGLGRLRGTGIVGPRPNGSATLQNASAAQAAMLGVASAAPAAQAAMLPLPTGAREALILEHQPLVRRVARHCAKSLPYWLEEDDLVSAGQHGLIEAADKYDPARGIPFAGFAYLLIRGRIIDANRRRNYDWELYDRLDGGDAGGKVELAGDASENDERIRQQQLRAILDSAIAALDERDRLACETYLGDGRTLKELGDDLGMTESGACLVRNKARARLREVLLDMGIDGRELD
jgi:RNA polymerase sigma factor for flagellar operon FliA